MVGGKLTGSGEVKEGKLKLKHKLEKDLITEGDETLELKLFRDSALTEQVGETKEIVVLDKSKSPESSARLFGNSSDNNLIEGRGDDNLRGDPSVDYLYGGVGNNKSYEGDGDDTLIEGTGADREIISDYDNETNRIELIDALTESDLTCSYLGVDKQIKYENDLMTIIQNAIAEDFTFI